MNKTENDARNWVPRPGSLLSFKDKNEYYETVLQNLQRKIWSLESRLSDAERVLRDEFGYVRE